MEFKVGDLMYVDKSYMDGEFNKPPKNRICKIVSIYHYAHVKEVGLEFFDDINGHSCRRSGTERHCWNIHERHLRKITTNNKPLTIKYPYGIMYI